MKLHKVLQPEVVMGLRDWVGPFKAEHYKMALSSMSWDPKLGYGYGGQLAKLVNTSPLWNSARYEDLAMSYKFTQERPPIYHSPKPFLQALSKVDREIPVDLLPERFFAYFSFAENSVWDGEDWVGGMYVFIGPARETSIGLQHWDCPKIFWSVYHTQPTKDRPVVEVARALMDLKDQKFSEIANGYKVDKLSQAASPDVFRLGVNLALYVNSVGRELVEAPPVRSMRPLERRLRTIRGEAMNFCTLPVTLISWSYEKSREHHVDTAWVDTHLRWQRCGPKLMQVKLIWVSAHERKFK